MRNAAIRARLNLMSPEVPKHALSRGERQSLIDVVLLIAERSYHRLRKEMNQAGTHKNISAATVL